MSGIAPASWSCPECDGTARPGTIEREPVRCDACGAQYIHPRLALLLSLALPGLGSLVQRRWLWGGLVLLFGTGAFVWTLWRMALHLIAVWNDTPDIRGLLLDILLGGTLVLLSYGADTLVVWLLRDRLVRRR